MVDRLQRYLDTIGLLDRMRQEQESFTDATLFGKDFSNIGPQLGGLGVGDLLRPAIHGAQALGLGLEAAGEGAKAIGGYAALPAVIGQSYMGDDSELTRYAQSMIGSPDDPIEVRRAKAREYMLHPGRQITALRNSPDRFTSYAAGALEMASDPTNVLSFPVSAPMRAYRASKAAARSNAGKAALTNATAGLSDEFLAGLATPDEGDSVAIDLARMAARKEAAPDRLAYADELLSQEDQRLREVGEGKGRVASLRERLGLAKENTKAREFELGEFKDYYKDARSEAAAALKAAREQGQFTPLRRPSAEMKAMGIFDMPENEAIKAENEATRVRILDDVLSRYAGGPKQGMTYREFMDQPKQAYYQALNEEKKIADLYSQAVSAAPKPIKYDNQGRPLGKDKNLFRKPEANTEFASGGEDSFTYGTPNFNTADISREAPDSPMAVKAAVDRLQALAQQGPEGTAAPLSHSVSHNAGQASLDAEVLARNPALGPAAPPLSAQEQAIAALPGAQNIRPDEARGFGSRMSDLLSHALREGWSEQKRAMERGGAMVNFSELASIWKGMTTQTLRNIFMDEAFTRILAADAGIQQQYMTRSKDYIIKRLREAEGGEPGQENPLLLLGDVSDVLSQVGIGKTLTAQQRKEIVEKIGINVFEAETENIRDLSAMQHMLGSAVVGLANPVRASVGLAAMPLGYLAPMRQRMFHIINNVTHMAAKGEAFKQGFLPALENSANRLLALAEAEGKNVTALRGWGMDDPTGAGQLIREGAFSPERVRIVLGDRYAAEWERMRDFAMEQGYKNATDVFGNYAKRGKAENAVAKFFPFMSWTWRAYPRVARMLLSHPVVMAATLQLYQAEIEDAKVNKRPGYAATTISFNRETPFVGVLARAFSPDQEAEVRVNPMALFMPFSSEGVATVAGVNEGKTAETPYQQAEKVGSVLGLSPAPAIQALAYVNDWDYQSPGPLSRYSQVDQMQDDLGIPTVELPSIAHGTLRAAREKISGEKDSYDPVANKVEELVYERTGRPISDPQNRLLAAEIKMGDHPLLTEAERIVDVQGAGRQAFGAITPISAQVQSETAANKLRAGKQPFTYEEVQEMKSVHPRLAKMMQQANDEWLAEHPEAAVNKDAKLLPVDMLIAKGARTQRLRQQLGVPTR